MARRRNPARLVIALSVAAVLAVFLLYTSFAGGATPSLRPSELADHSGKVSLAGNVVGPVSGDPRGDGMRFRLRDIDGSETVAVVYQGSVPGPVPGRPSGVHARRAAQRRLRRRARLARDEVPVEVRADRELACPSSVEPRSSSLSG